MRQIYNFLFVIFFFLSAPYYFLKMRRRGNWKEGFSQRFGRYSSKIKQAITNRHVLWIHAVSVGEVYVATQLIAALERNKIPVAVVDVSNSHYSSSFSKAIDNLRRLPFAKGAIVVSTSEDSYYPLPGPRKVVDGTPHGQLKWRWSYSIANAKLFAKKAASGKAALSR